MRTISRGSLFLILFAFLALPRPARPGVLIPRGDVFTPLFADPKEIRTTVNLLWVSSKGRDATLGLVGFGDHWGIFRWRGPRPNEGWQIGITGGVFAQFDMRAISMDLINADYLVGFPVSWRANRTSARFRVFHQSSHLGDEFLLNQRPERVNLSYEAFELIVSQEIGLWRFYGGGEWLFHRKPDEMKPLVSHLGLEYRAPLSFFRNAQGRAVRWVAALDAKTTQEHAVVTGWDLKTGFEFGPRDESDLKSRPWSLTLEYYNGPSPYSQYFYEKIVYGGIGFQLGL